MADRFWVTGGNGNPASTTNWSATTGGASGASVPGTSDNAIWDANSGTGTVTFTNTAFTVINFDASAFLGNITGTGACNMTITGDFKFGGTSDALFGNGSINLTATTTGKTISFGGRDINSTFVVNGSGGGWTASDQWGQTATRYSSITMQAGTLNLGAQTLYVGAINKTNATACTIDATNATINLANMNLSGANLTFTKTGSTIVFALGTGQINSAVTLQDVSFTGTAATTVEFRVVAGTTLTVAGTLTVNGNSVINRVYLRTPTFASPATINAAAIAFTNVDIQDITAAGAASWDVSAITGGAGDGGGNTGITFAASKNCYMKTAASVNWSASNWYTTSGGSTPIDPVIPMLQDVAIFDANSVTAGSCVITQNMPRICGVNWTGVVNSPTFTTTGVMEFYGDFILASAMTFTNSSGNKRWVGRGSYVVNCAGKSWNGGSTFTFDSVTGTYTLGANLTFNNTGSLISLTSGTLTCGAFNVTVGGSTFGSGTGKVLNMGSGTWTITGTSGVWNALINAPQTINTQTALLDFTNTSASVKSAAMGTLTYSSVRVRGAASNGAFTFSGACTIGNFTADPYAYIKFTAGVTTIFTNPPVFLGASGQVITIESSSSGSAATLSCASGLIRGDWLSIKDSTATGGAAWYAGANSTNVSGNTGWIFTAPVFNDSFTETVTASDNEDVIVTFSASFTDSVTANDSMDSAAVFVDAFTDSVTANDSMDSAAVFVDAFTDSVFAADAISATLSFYESLLETVTASDSVSEGSVYNNSVVESVEGEFTLTARIISVYGVFLSGKVLDIVPVSGFVDQ